MAASTSASAMDDHESERDYRADHSPSRFTAVNGKDLLLSGGGSATTPNGSSNNQEQRDVSEGWKRHIHEDTLPRHDDRTRENGTTEHEQDDQRSQRSLSRGGSPISRSKRKRSESDEQGDDYMSQEGPRSPASRLDESIDGATQPPTSNGNPAIHSDRELKSNSAAAVNLRSEDKEASRASSTNASWHDYDSQLINQAQRAQQIDASDAQLAEALQREAHGQDATQKDWGVIHRTGEVQLHSDHPSPVSAFAQERQQTAVQVAPKRKRNNCIRGGFLCEGYSSRSTWQKPSNAKTPVPLQSKDGYADIGSQYIHEVSQHHDRQHNLNDQLEAGKIRPIIVDEGDRSTSQFNSSPTGPTSNRGSWSKRNWPGTAHPAYIPEHIPKSDYREVPSIHELPREGHPKTDYQIVPPIRELSHTHGKQGVSLFQSGIDQRPTIASTIDTTSPQAQARMALSIEHQLSTRTVSGEETEKDKMIRGELYRPFDVHLVEERERCRTALWRFNSACNPVSGLNAKEQNRLLKEVLVPHSSPVGSPSGVSSPRATGTIGQGALVEAPFQCHYGYNIHIGEDVMVSESCLFVDDCPITIGAHTWIGPKVTILSSMAHANMQERKGTQSRYQGRPVTIEEDCYVGAGCIIYPGVRLRRGAYVAPGEIVKSDIVAYGFQGLKPSYM
ncbi:putative Zn(II)2Cys6 transcription factor [Aspergillus affinis]|uniref:putative Zn(II)2Cys6 transcription factor n=1 Tax=Aspergillus affinis TaxID=1070780 RepID=UPI0022FE7ECD|nr:putative Zn(II)2Cys6 transcription factor [Aspergillus affinis]KAI9038526.1 putative Zn(II)2Cys6 transcription factor [Aspergillus affinis]